VHERPFKRRARECLKIIILSKTQLRNRPTSRKRDLTDMLALLCELLGGSVKWHLVPGLTFITVLQTTSSFGIGVEFQKLNRKTEK